MNSKMTQSEQPHLTLSPRVDVLESKQAFLVLTDMPGVCADDLSIEYDDGELRISGTRTLPKVEGEPISGAAPLFDYTRSFRLDGIDPSSIEAKLSQGQLTLTLPKVAKAQPRAIPVTVQ